MNFWASWCPPCVAEMRDTFEPLHAELGERVAFLGVDVQDTPAAARQAVGRTGGVDDAAAVDRAVAVARALRVGVIVAAGFIAVFSAAGLLLSAGARAVTTAMPWAALVVGAPHASR